MIRNIKDYSLYLVISEECCVGRSALEVARSAISGGVDIVQMREKDKPRKELLKLGLNLSSLCKEHNVTFIVNDDPTIAKEVDADGVHLGQEDVKSFSIKESRDIIGSGKIIGLSTHSLGEFKKANDSDADYIAFGPIFKTKTKDYFIGTKDIKEVMSIGRKPIFFIGGIDLSNIDIVLAEGGRNIALIRGIAEAGDIRTRARQFKERLERQKELVDR